MVLPTTTPLAPGGSEDVPGIGSPGAAGSVPVRVGVEVPDQMEGNAPGDLPAVNLPGHTPGPTQRVVPPSYISNALVLEPVGCIEDFRNMLAQYSGPEVFGPEVAQRLSDDFLRRRVDCADKGWAPAFSLAQAGKVNKKPACYEEVTMRTDGHDSTPLGPGFFYLDRYSDELMMGPTTSIPRGMGNDVLVHFDRLPLDPGSFGCWYKQGRVWWWLHLQREPYAAFRGRDLPVYRSCESLLRKLLVDEVGIGLLDVEGVARLRTVAQESLPTECTVAVGVGGSSDWNLFPQAEPRSGCPVTEPTGGLPDGGLVVHWHPGFTDSAGGSACWVLSPEGGWGFYAPAPESDK